MKQFTNSTAPPAGPQPTKPNASSNVRNREPSPRSLIRRWSRFVRKDSGQAENTELASIGETVDDGRPHPRGRGLTWRLLPLPLGVVSMVAGGHDWFGESPWITLCVGLVTASAMVLLDEHFARNGPPNAFQVGKR